MFADDFLVLPFDPSGTNTKNDIKGEEHVIDKTCPWLVLNGSPYLAGSLVIKDKNGQIITTGFEEMLHPTPLIELTGGTDMCMFIYLEDEILNGYDKLFIDYHCMGIRYFPASDAAEQLYDIIHGKAPIPWSKVIQLPSMFPSKYHWHSSTELMDWQDLVLYAQYLCGVFKSRSDNTPTWESTYTKITASIDLLIAQCNIVNTNQINHGSNYSNPHHTTAADLLLGNLNNYATATLQDEINGTRSDLFSTPAGGVAVIQQAMPEAPDIVKSGTFPMSLFGSGDYLPPIIDGSYEGLGSDDNRSAICLENSGRLMILKPYFDGRQKALYFDYIENYKVLNSKNYFTGFKYSNKQLGGLGINPDTVVSGSGQNILIVGDSTQNRWFASLTHGTLNPDTHVFTELNLSNIPYLDFGIDKYFTCFKTGNWLVISVYTTIFNDASIRFYRAPVSALIGNGVVSFTQFNLTFTDVNGLQHNNVDNWVPDVPVKDANGNYTRFLHNYVPYMDWLEIVYNRMAIFATNESDVAIMKVAYRPHTSNSALSPIFSLYWSFDVTVSIDVNTGTVIMLDHTPVNTINAYNGNNQPVEQHGFLHQLTAISFDHYNAVITPDGFIVIIASLGNARSFPNKFVSLWMGVNDDYTGLQKRISPANWPSYDTTPLTPFNGYIYNLEVDCPLANGSSQLVPAYDEQGELFPCYDQQNVNPIIAYRKVSGNYAVRSGISNTKLSNLLARPLVNQVYKTNLPFNYPLISWSGDNTAVNNAGLEMGMMGFGSVMLRAINGAWETLMPAATGITHIQNNLFTFIRTASKQFNDDTMTMVYNPLTYFGISAATLNSLNSLLINDLKTSTYKAFKLVMPIDYRGGQTFNFGNIGYLECTWYSDADKSKLLATTVKVSFTVVMNNGIFELTNPVADQPLNVGSGNGQGNTRNIYWFDPGFSVSPLWNMFQTGNTIQSNCIQGMTSIYVADSATLHRSLTIDMTTKAITASSYPLVAGGYNKIESTPIIPRVGYGSVYDFTYSGDAALLAKGPDGNNYLLESVYPDTGWVVYFKSGTFMTINGTEYPMPTGMIDLRDIDPNPQNKTFYLYASAYGGSSYYIVSGKRITPNLSIIPIAEVITNSNQILTLTRFNTFMIGDAVMSNIRGPGVLPVSVGMPMDEGTFNFTRQSDYTAH